MSEQRIPLPHIAARVFDTPLLIAQSKLEAILHVLGPRMGFEVDVSEGEPGDFERMDSERYEAALNALAPVGMRAERRAEGYYVLNGVAVVPVLGTLLHRASWMHALSGMTSYGAVEAMVSAAQRDPFVREVLLEVDSFGGESSGAFDTADRLHAMRGAKPMRAVIAEAAASGAYLLASTADEIIIPRTGIAGSIGVVGAHFDQSKAMERKGIAVTYVYAGERKIDGSPFMPLTEPARAEWQEKINAIYGLFVDSIARYVGLSAEAIRKQEAAVFMGERAVSAGLAHRLGSFEHELRAAVARQAGPFRLDAQRKEADMSEQQQQGNGGTATLTAADVDRARSEGHAAGIKEGGAAAVAADRNRIRAILNSEHAAGRMALAMHVALESDMPEQAAISMLEKAPKESKQSKLDAAMSRAGTPGIKSQEAGGDEPRAVPRISAGNVYSVRRERAQIVRSGGR